MTKTYKQFLEEAAKSTSKSKKTNGTFKIGDYVRHDCGIGTRGHVVEILDDGDMVIQAFNGALFRVDTKSCKMLPQKD